MDSYEQDKFFPFDSSPDEKFIEEPMSSDLMYDLEDDPACLQASNMDAENQSHLSALATPDKAQETEGFVERLLSFCERLRGLGLSEFPEDLYPNIKSCRGTTDVRKIVVELLTAVSAGLKLREIDCPELIKGMARIEQNNTFVSIQNIFSELECMDWEKMFVKDSCDVEPESAASNQRVKQEDDEGPPKTAPSTTVTCTSRYGRARNVPNFARMVDPLSNRSGGDHSSSRERGISNALNDEAQSTANQNMIEIVKNIMNRLDELLDSSIPIQTQDKYVGVRVKQAGYGAVIKKNHIELNLGTFTSVEEAARAYDVAALLCQGDRAKLNFVDSIDLVRKYDSNLIRDVAPLRSNYCPINFDSVDLENVSIFGDVLNDLADRIPYGAVRDLDAAFWDMFSEKNKGLQSFQDFGLQLLWLTSQIEDKALNAVFLANRLSWEERCRACKSGTEAVELVRELEERGINWDKVKGIWEAAGKKEMMGKDCGVEAPQDGQNADDSCKNVQNVLPMKRKRSEPNNEFLSSFLRLNWHVIAGHDSEASTACQGLEPTLEYIRQNKRHTMTGLAGMLAANRLYRDGQGRVRHSSFEHIGKCRGLICRFCGKEFTHAPAHLQHERAHMQQQETKNPSSRIFQHMMPGMNKASIRATLHSQDVLGMKGLNDRCPSETAQVSFCNRENVFACISEFVTLIPMTAVQFTDSPETEELPSLKSENEQVKSCLRDLLQIEKQLNPCHFQPDWKVKESSQWARDCESVLNEDGLVAIVSRLFQGINWVNLNQKVEEMVEFQESLRPEAVNACGSDAKMCIEQGLPCPLCARMSKGVAACFAQGHLYISEDGELPTSCKECKLRNKGAFFCFKRGHMARLRAVPFSSEGVPASNMLPDVFLGSIIA